MAIAVLALSYFYYQANGLRGPNGKKLILLKVFKS